MSAVEQDRGWGGTWMAGCTWWVVGWDSRRVCAWEGLFTGPPVAPRCAGGQVGPHPRPLSTMWRGVGSCFRGDGGWIPVGVRMTRRWSRSAGRSGCGDWQGRGARLPGTAGAGRPARARWRWVRHADGADPAPSPWWRGVRQHPVPATRHSDGHAPPPAVRRGVARDPVPSVRHSDSADPAPPPSWRGVRQHPVPARRHSGGHAAPHSVRRGVAHGPVPSAGWLCHRR